MTPAEEARPRPIDSGRVKQAIVEYRGPRMGAASYRGPSGREYRFAATLADRRRYVLDEDLEHFQRLLEFEILEEGRIDPEVEKLEALKREIAQEVLEQLPSERQPAERRDTSRPPGRPAGRGFGALLDCLITCGQIEELRSVHDAYDAIWYFYSQHELNGLYVPPRERFPSVRSDAKRKRERAGRCLWYQHPEPVPDELAET